MSITYLDTHERELSRNTFMLLTGLLTLYSIGITTVASYLSMATHFVPSVFAMVCLLVLPIVGIFVANSGSSLAKVVGLHMITVPFGLLLGPVLVATLEFPGGPGIVYRTLVFTFCGTGIMTLLATLYPTFFARIGSILFACLIGLILVRLVTLFVPSMHSTWIEYFAVAIFCGFIGFDWYRASEVHPNPENALNVAINLYLDILNLFMALLNISSASSSD